MFQEYHFQHSCQEILWNVQGHPFTNKLVPWSIPRRNTLICLTQLLNKKKLPLPAWPFQATRPDHMWSQGESQQVKSSCSSGLHVALHHWPQTKDSDLMVSPTWIVSAFYRQGSLHVNSALICGLALNFVLWGKHQQFSYSKGALLWGQIALTLDFARGTTTEAQGTTAIPPPPPPKRHSFTLVV